MSAMLVVEYTGPISQSILQAGLFAMVLQATRGVFATPILDDCLALASVWIVCRARPTTGLMMAG